MVSSRVNAISESSTIKLLNKENELRKKGENIISFSIGEPDFTTPRNIIDFAYKSMLEGKTHYTPSSGIPMLREKIAEKYSKRYSIDLNSNNVLVTPTKFALFISIFSLVDEGDEVLLPDPGWVSYSEMVKMAGGIPKFYSLKENDGFSIDQEDLKNKINEKTRVILINTPSNPTGTIIKKEDMDFLKDFVMERNVYIISDEIYDKLVYDGNFVSILNYPEIFHKTIFVNGFSKSHAMTGWRIGYMIAESDLIKIFDKVQQHTLTCAPSISQYAALKAIDDDKSVMEMVDEFKKRRDYIYSRISKISIFNTVLPNSTFYIFPKFNLPMNSMEFSELLLEKAKVSVVPGISFGKNGENHIRISFATSMENIKEGMDRIEDTFK